MQRLSVVSARRLRVAIARQRDIAIRLIAACGLCVTACGHADAPTSPSQSPTAETQTGLIDGTVHDADGALAGALVEVTGPPGGSATTSANGVFSFKLPVGITRLRSSKYGYYASEHDVIVQPGATAKLDVVLVKTSVTAPFPQPPYTVRGLVRNARGLPVGAAEIWIYGNSSPVDNRYGTTWTDGGGQYTVASPHRVPQAVRAMKDGHIPRDVAILGVPDAPSTWTVDVVLVHIDRYAFLPLPSVVVGQSARLETQVDLDDGSTKRGSIFMQLTSSDPSVLQVQPTGSVQGIAPGTATVTSSYYGVTATIRVRVDPS